MWPLPFFRKDNCASEEQDSRGCQEVCDGREYPRIDKDEGLYPDEADLLREEAEDLRLKLEALRAADYRDQLRASCVKPAIAAEQAADSNEEKIIDEDPSAQLATSSSAAATTEAQQLTGLKELHGSQLETQGGASGSTSLAEDSNDTSASTAEEVLIAEHYIIEDNMIAEECDLDAMYDFSRFVPNQAGVPMMATVRHQPGAQNAEPDPNACSSGDIVAPQGDLGQEETIASRRLKQAKLKEREARFHAQLEVQNKNLATASKALQKTKNQVQQLTAQLGLKELHGSKLETQVTVLKNAVVEKEKRLQDALDEAAVALQSAQDFRSTTDESEHDRDVSEVAVEDAESDEALSANSSRQAEAHQPQEPPVSRPPPTPSVDEQQLLQLARITEELTDALESAREGEEDVRRQLHETAARLQFEQAWREYFQRDLVEARAQRDAEVTDLQARLHEQEAAIALERQKNKELEERAKRMEVEDRLHNALATKGKTKRYPHLAV